jgi:hypothetical protein
MDMCQLPKVLMLRGMRAMEALKEARLCEDDHCQFCNFYVHLLPMSPWQMPTLMPSPALTRTCLPAWPGI